MTEIMTEITAEITKEVEQRLQPLTHRYQQFMQKLRNPAQASFDLGCEMIRRGLFKEASYRFKFTLWRQPQRAGAWYNLALCHFALGEVAKGIVAIKRSLTLNAKNEAALYLLATIQEGKYAGEYQPHTTPVEIIKTEFAVRAENFEADELAERGYTAHFSLYETLMELLKDEEHRLDSVLDAGCGTGLLGEMMRPLCQNLTGIDLSQEMLSRARIRKDTKGKLIYDHLVEGDLRAHLLHHQKPAYHCIVASNVAPLLGGLAPMLDGTARALHPGGLLAFNALPMDKQEGYRLLSNIRRFAHSENYLRQVAQKSGLTLHSLSRKPFYEGHDGWVVILHKHA